MIEFLQGQLCHKEANSIVLQVGGIGYRLSVSSITMQTLPPIKNDVTIYTYLHVREDDLSMYGFCQIEERDFFLLLLSVSGVGPKMALAILSSLKTAQLKKAIILGDINDLVKVQGVGKKTAQRIILELKDKVGKADVNDVYEQAETSSELNVRKEAVSALMALGYNLTEAQKAVSDIKIEVETISIEEVIRIALKNLVKL